MPGDAVAEIKLGEIDRKLLANAATGYSPEENSRRIGGVLNPAQVILRIHKLVSEPDNYLSTPQQIQLQLREMREVYSEIRAQYRDLDNAKVLLQYSRAIIDTLEKLQARNDVDVNAYNANVGRSMARAFDIGLSFIAGALSDKVTPEEWAIIKRNAMESVQAEIIRGQVEQ